EAGILVRGGEALENAHRVTAVILDKTGTLTRGKPAVAEIIPAGDLAEDDLLRLAAAVEAGSEHPLASAILLAARERGLAFPGGDAFAATAGGGAEATVEGRAVLVGSARFLAERGVDVGELIAAGEAHAAVGRTPVFVAVDGAPAGLLAIADPVKPESAEAVRALEAAGIEAWLVTGDQRATALAVAAQVGIPPERVRAQVLPGDKAGVVDELRARGKVVAMVGDGINDAPALAAADLGIAIGTGADVAIEASDITLVGGDPRGVVAAIALSRRTMAVIRQNLFWAFAYNVALIPIAMGALFPFFGITLNPAMAAGAMALSSVSVISNSLRLRGYDPRPAAVLAASRHRAWTRVRDAAYLAVIAGLAVGIAASVIGVNRWLDAAAIPVELRASALDGPTPIYQVAAGEQVRVTFLNDADVLLVCTLPGAPKLELNPRPGQEQAARFSLGEPGRFTLSCAPLEQTAAADGEPEDGMAVGGMGGGPAMGGAAAMPAAVFEVR
ncbi:MAG: HAD-IC family P-type ATPase, partial [Chloroflexota bacterium]